MKFIKLAFRNLFRNTRRTVLTVAAVAVVQGVAQAGVARSLWPRRRAMARAANR